MFDKEFLGTSLSATPGSKGVALPPFLCNQWCQHQIEAASYTSRPRPVQSEMISEEVCSTGLLRKALTVQSHQEGTSFWGNLLRRVSVGDTIWRGHVGPCPLGGFPFFFFLPLFQTYIFLSFLLSFFFHPSLPPWLFPPHLCFLSFFLPFLQHRKVYCRAKQGEGFPGGSVVKNPPANAGDTDSIPGPGRSPGERNGNPFPPVFLPEKSHGQRSHVG